MLIPIWICILISEAIIKIECAPKLGHILFEPLSYEAEFQRVINELIPKGRLPENESTTTPIPSLETSSISEEDSIMTLTDKTVILFKDKDAYIKQLSKSLRYGYPTYRNEDSCEEYYLNDKKCKVVNDRILCGYEKNKGEIKNNEIIDLGNDCRLRNDRIECGYHKPPYRNHRRPSAWDRSANNVGAKLMLQASHPLTLEIEDGDSCPDCSFKNPEEAAAPHDNQSKLLANPVNKGFISKPIEQQSVVNISAPEETQKAADRLPNLVEI